MATNPVKADSGKHLAVAVDDPDPVGVIQGHEPRQRFRVHRLPEGRAAAEGSRPEGHFVPLDPVLGGGEQAVSRPMVVVEVRDERDGHVGRLDTCALDHLRRADIVAHPARSGVVVEAAGVHEDGTGAAEDQPDEVVEREGVVRRLAVEELAGGRVPLGILQREDFVHDSARPPGVSSGIGRLSVARISTPAQRS